MAPPDRRCIIRGMKLDSSDVLGYVLDHKDLWNSESKGRLTFKPIIMGCVFMPVLSRQFISGQLSCTEQSRLTVRPAHEGVSRLKQNGCFSLALNVLTLDQLCWQFNKNNQRAVNYKRELYANACVWSASDNFPGIMTAVISCGG